MSLPDLATLGGPSLSIISLINISCYDYMATKDGFYFSWLVSFILFVQNHTIER